KRVAGEGDRAGEPATLDGADPQHRCAFARPIVLLDGKNAAVLREEGEIAAISASDLEDTSGCVAGRQMLIEHCRQDLSAAAEQPMIVLDPPGDLVPALVHALELPQPPDPGCHL